MPTNSTVIPNSHRTRAECRVIRLRHFISGTAGFQVLRHPSSNSIASNDSDGVMSATHEEQSCRAMRTKFRCCNRKSIHKTVGNIAVDFFLLEKFEPPTPKSRARHPAHAKKPPGNRVAFSLGRIVPTEARPSELSWRHSMGGLLGCQGQIIFAVKRRFYCICWMYTGRSYGKAHSPYFRPNTDYIQNNPCCLFALLVALHHTWFS